MKRLFAVVIVLALLVVGLGFYRGWFALSSSGGTAESNKTNVNLSVDSGKMKEDARLVKNKTTEWTGSAEEETREPAAPPTDAAPPDAE